MKSTLPYSIQRCALLDKVITLWRIKNVFGKRHQSYCGNVTDIIMLDNFHTHDIDMSLLPHNITIISIPLNIKNLHHKINTGIILSMKIGYKYFYLRTLLDIFDVPGGFYSVTKL